MATDDMPKKIGKMIGAVMRAVIYSVIAALMMYARWSGFESALGSAISNRMTRARQPPPGLRRAMNPLRCRKRNCFMRAENDVINPSRKSKNPFCRNAQASTDRQRLFY